MRRRLFFDIETSPNIGFFWQAGHEIDVGTHNIINEREIICICWKWEGKKKVYSLKWDKKQSDKKMVKEFVDIMLSADEVIGHNSDKFDIKWIRTRAIFHQIPFPPKVISIDTLKNCRTLFNMNSNRLDYVAKYLGIGYKIDTGGFDTWRKIILYKDDKALKKIVRYCKNDVIILEKLWERLNPYSLPKTHAGHWSNQCPECGSFKIVINKTVKMASGYTRLQMRCTNCGKYHSIVPSKLTKVKPI